MYTFHSNIQCIFYYFITIYSLYIYTYLYRYMKQGSFQRSSLRVESATGRNYDSYLYSVYLTYIRQSVFYGIFCIHLQL